jgi:tetratricopeptide (TPR) repeat protein
MVKSVTPADPAALFALARRHEAEGRLSAAEGAYQQMLAALPGHPEVLRALALVSHRRGRAIAARRYIERAIEAAPRIDSYMLLSGLCAATGDYGAALVACAAAARIAPADPVPALEMARIHVALADYPSAEEALLRALQIRPGLPAAMANLGSALFAQGRFAEAEAAHRVMLAAFPDHAVTWKNLGAALRALGDFNASHAAYETAIRFAPEYAEARRDLAMLDMLRGDEKTGFAGYEWRFHMPVASAPALAGRRWLGEPVEGKTLLLHWEQGLGDTIQCLRYVPLAAARAGRIILRVQPPLERLAASVPGVARLLTARDALPRYDVYANLLSLPHLLGLGEARFAPGAPYLAPPEPVLTKWQALLPAGGARRVGLVWSGNPAHENDRQRSIDPGLLAPVLATPGCVFFNLNPAAQAPRGVLQPPATLADCADTAAVTLQMDLVLTVDTAAAHLAGALGRPVWVLLPAVPDWRWGLQGEASAWYESARLYRQRARGDWAPVLARVAADLKAAG